MATSFSGKLAHAWNAFKNPDTFEKTFEAGESFGFRPHTNRTRVFNDKSIISSIYTRLAIDFSEIPISHVRLDEEQRFAETVKSGLQECLSVEANLDQAATAFRLDVALTLFDEGVIAIVPVDTTVNPGTSGGYDIRSLRVGKIVAWHPKHVRVDLYNEKTGRREQVTLAKTQVAIVENPLYNVMNETNSTMQRLIRKLSLLDSVDEALGSGKLDLIIQLPYVIKSEARQQQADQRRANIEMQLKGSKYGIAYTDATEKVTQLNRPAENNMLAQVQYLTGMLYAQLGLTESVFDGTADEATMINYHNRTIKPLMTAVTEAMKRSFLTKTARSQGQSIKFFRDPFSLVPISQIAEIADKLTRNEILSSNEVRQAIGVKPAKDPKADELRNSNIPAESQEAPAPTAPNKEGALQNEG